MSAEDRAEQGRVPSAEELPDLLVELEQAGGNVAAFARERGLAAWKLYNAKRKATATATVMRRAKIDLVPVRLSRRSSPSPAPLELVLSSGHRLVVPPGFDETELRRLMGVLASC